MKFTGTGLRTCQDKEKKKKTGQKCAKKAKL